MLRSDNAELKKKKWEVMVIDEAQNIKNQTMAQSKAVRSIPAGTHIAMSGTPVENRLTEFWTIMDFVNKGYLGNAKQFSDDSKITWYNLPQIFELFWILEEGVMRASRLMRGFKTAKKMRHYHDIRHITNCTKLFLNHHLRNYLPNPYSLMVTKPRANVSAP